MIGTATIEQYDKESVLIWNFYPEELNTMRLLGVRTIGDLLSRYGEIDRLTNHKLFDRLQFITDEAKRLGLIKN